MECPTETSWRLNERHYGALTGLHKTETMDTWGAERTMAMRRGNAAPPPMDEDHPMWKHVSRGRERLFQSGQLPRTESLPDCRERVWDYWRHQVVPSLGDLLPSGDDHEDHQKSGVLVVSHLHTIRLLIAELDGLSQSELYALEVPTAVPLVYGVDKNLVDLHESLSPGESARTHQQDVVIASKKTDGSNQKVAMVKGKWLGETRLTAMQLPAVRSLLLRRRGLLYELLPNLPEPIQNLFFDPNFEQEAAAVAEETVKRCRPLRERLCDDGYFRPDGPTLRNKDQLKALQRLFFARPWIGHVDNEFADACARALYAVSVTDPTSPPRRKYDGLRSGYHRDEEDDDVETDDTVASWANDALKSPPRAAAAALTFALGDSSKAAPFVGAPVAVSQFPHFARLVGVAAYLAWLQTNGAEFLPPREYSFTKDIAKKGTLTPEEIKADLATHVDGDDFQGKDVLTDHVHFLVTPSSSSSSSSKKKIRPHTSVPPVDPHQNKVRSIYQQ